MKTRYFIFISYKGTCYHGWQLQPNSVTVQQKIDDALSVLLNEKVVTTGAGRTDTGVHARMFCAHFDCSASGLSDNNKIIFRLNGLLPPDISVGSIRKVLPDASARFSAISRTYKYYISKIKDPFFDGYSWFLHGNFNTEAMNESCGLLASYSDFTSFARLHSDTKTNICRIIDANWEETGNRLIFTIKADRFLRNMVRAIAGTMVEIGSGKLDLEEFDRIIRAKDRSRAGRSAPARGLFLTEIEYPEEIFLT